jgi:DNA modification methylase
MKTQKRIRSRERRSISPGPLKLEERPLTEIRPAKLNAREHSDKQISQIAASIREFGFTNPILVDENNVVIAGHGRLAAAKLIGRPTVPIIRLCKLSAGQKRALGLADNKIAENATWNRETLAIELQALSIEIKHDLEITGFSSTEIDLLLDPAISEDDGADEVPEPENTPVSRLGDVWRLGEHRLIVGDTREMLTIEKLMGSDKAHAVFADVPYNVEVNGHVRLKGRTKHREFAAASGEMSEEEFDTFLDVTLGNMAAVCTSGAINFICMDWRHIEQLLRVGGRVFHELKNIAVWAKTNAGMGTFYRSQHEFIAIFKAGTAPHQNNFGLGDGGRYRSNLWQHAGANSFQARRKETLELHPTVKPVVLVADAIKDVTRRGQIVLDGFAGSGTTLIAAEKTGRIARVAEIDPLYADVIVRRWEEFTGKKARHCETGYSFAKTSNARNSSRAGARK